MDDGDGVGRGTLTTLVTPTDSPVDDVEAADVLDVITAGFGDNNGVD